MMSKLLKFLKYAVLTIVALVIIGVVLVVYNTEIELAYNKAVLLAAILTTLLSLPTALIM
jgi:branched-subunit amino acid transport protein